MVVQEEEPVTLAKEELKRVYKSSKFHEARKAAGKALGYSSLRIWAHEHPVTAIFAGYAAAGATSGLVSALVKYFSK